MCQIGNKPEQGAASGIPAGAYGTEHVLGEIVPIAANSDADFRTGTLMVLSMMILVPLGLLVALTSIEGVSLFAGVTTYVAIPTGVAVGPLLAWRSWRAFRAKDYIYVNKEGDTVQQEPGVAALQAIVIACVLAVIITLAVQAVFRFAVKVMPGHPVAFQSHVTGLGSGRSCHMNVEYADIVTSSSARICSELAPGKRWVGEPVTVHDSVGIFGAKLERLSFDDTYGTRCRCAAPPNPA